MPNNPSQGFTRLFNTFGLKPLENLLIGFMGLIVACGVFVSNATHVNYVTTPFYAALLLIWVYLLSVDEVLALLLLSMMSLVAMVLFQSEFSHWNSASQLLRNLALLAPIVLLVLRSKHVSDDLRRKETYTSGAQRLTETGCFGFRSDTGIAGWLEQSARIWACAFSVQSLIFIKGGFGPLECQSGAAHFSLPSLLTASEPGYASAI